MSTNSFESSALSFTTFEWAYALGKGKVLIPVKMNECLPHPRLQEIQYLDFSVPGALPWDSLIEKIQGVEREANAKPAEREANADPAETHTDAESADAAAAASTLAPDDLAKQILTYLNQRGYQFASLDRLRRRIDESLTKKQLDDLIVKYPATFRHVRLADGRDGIGKVIP
jgi:hypothetical protein